MVFLFALLLNLSSVSEQTETIETYYSPNDFSIIEIIDFFDDE